MDIEPGLIKVAGGLEFPEGPAYDGKGSVYCSNCDSNYITKVTADGQVSVAFRGNSGDGEPFTFKKTNGMTFFEDGALFACDFERNAIIRIAPDGSQEIYVDNLDGQPFAQPNDLAFDPSGHLYFTAPGGSSETNPIGPIYRVERGTRIVTRVAKGMGFPNGLAFTADAKYLYVCESSFNRILRFEVRDDGSLDGKEVFADLSPDGPGAPDGMAVDAAGFLWITHYNAHTVLVVDTGGKIVRTIRVPFDGPNGPTNIEFAGKDLKTVYITDPGSAAMYKMEVETPGLPLFCAPPNEGP